MSVNWNWSEKCGEITLSQLRENGEWKDFPLTLYKGNCFLIMLSENDEDETYQMFSFFADKEHAKNCLGLNKKQGYGNNIFLDSWQKFTKLRIDKAKYPYVKDLVSMFAQAFDDITIEVFKS